MTEKEKKALERLKNTDVYNLGHDDRFEELRLYENAIDTALEELYKKDKVIDYLAEKLEEKSKSMTKGKWKIVAYNQVEKVGGEDE